MKDRINKDFECSQETSQNDRPLSPDDEESSDEDNSTSLENNEDNVGDNSRSSESNEANIAEISTLLEDNEDNVADDSWKSFSRTSNYEGSPGRSEDYQGTGAQYNYLRDRKGNSANEYNRYDQGESAYMYKGNMKCSADILPQGGFDSIKSRPSIHSPRKNYSGTGKEVNYFSAIFPGTKNYHWIFLIVLAGVLSYLYLWKSPSPPVCDVDMFLKNMEKNYPSYLKDLKIYVKQLNRSTVSQRIKDQNVIYTLLYSDNVQLANSVANEMATFGSQMLNGSGQAHIVDGTVVKNNPSSFNLDYVRKSTTEQRALVVHNLEQIPLEKIKLFHAICDRFTPFTDKSVVVITVFKIPRFQSTTNFQQKLLDYFNNVWPDLGEAYANAFFVRLTENTLRI